MEWTWRARGAKLVRKIVTRQRSCAKSTGRININEAWFLFVLSILYLILEPGIFKVEVDDMMMSL